MTSQPPTDDDITTNEAFDRALRRLLVTAIENDVDPWGAWEYRTDGVGVDVEVIVSKVDQSDETE